MEIIKPKPKLLNDISEIVDSLIEKYGCKNPFYIAKRLGIDYYFMDFNPDLLAFSERDGDKDPGRIYVAKDIEISNKVDVQCVEKFNRFMTSKIKYMIKLEKENPQEYKPERFFALYPDGKKYISFDYLTGEVEVIMPFDTKNILWTV